MSCWSSEAVNPVILSVMECTDYNGYACSIDRITGNRFAVWSAVWTSSSTTDGEHGGGDDTGGTADEKRTAVAQAAT
jgi:hypothetical protein